MNENFDWKAYYKLMGLDPRPLLKKAVEEFDIEATHGGVAVDLGSGKGGDSIYLANIGFEVIAIDSESDAQLCIDDFNTVRKKNSIEFINTSYENFEWKTLRLVNAQFALPFCDKNYFAKLIFDITRSIEMKGYFIGNFFGPNDEWSHLVRVSAEEVQMLFIDFEILFFSESESDTPTAQGNMKHWHLIDLIAQKK